MVKVLVVEDEASIREMIALNLRLAGMEAVEADSAEAALPLLEQRPGCDAAILDVMLPGMNGFSLCETIRRTDQKIGIIILSAKGQEQDKIRGLSIGADDYMTKPFSVSELLARVETVLRRCGLSLEAPCGSLPADRLPEICRTVKTFALPVLGPMGFDAAQVTAGGIRTDEFSAQTLESRLCPGLYAAGEVLDIDGDCGGYNLQWAWSSGRLAGQLLTGRERHASHS